MTLKRILLAETHPTFVGVVRLLLQETKGALIMVADEPSLIEAVAGTQFDLVIADLSFPVSSGENVARLLKRLNPELKAIILSVYEEQTVADECFAAGAKGFVLKRCIHRPACGRGGYFRGRYLHLARLLHSNRKCKPELN